MSQKRVGILRGGAGEYYASSLKKGGDIISYIFDNLGEKWKAVDILVEKDYIWHFNGVPVNPGDLIHKIDLAWNTSHPSLSNILESLSIPHLSNSSFSSALENNKDMLREHMKQIGVPMPRHIVLPVYQEDLDGPIERYAVKKAMAIFEKFGSPWMVKSFTPDLGMGVHIAKTFPELVDAIEDGVRHEQSILIEEFIGDKVASVHSVPAFRGEDIYIFPFGSAHVNFSADEKSRLANLAKDLHHHVGGRHYLKSDFVLNKRGKAYLLGIETTPDLRAGSHFSQACESAGAKSHQVIEHILESVLN